MPLNNDKEVTEHLMQYQLIAVVIQKALFKIVEKMKKGIELTDGDQVTIYEISLTFYVVIN